MGCVYADTFGFDSIVERVCKLQLETCVCVSVMVRQKIRYLSQGSLCCNEIISSVMVANWIYLLVVKADGSKITFPV